MSRMDWVWTVLLGVPVAVFLWAMAGFFVVALLGACS